MARGLSSAMQTASAAPLVRPGLLAYFDFASGPVRLWTGFGNLVWGGNTFSGMGDFLSIERVTEQRDIRASSLTLMLSGVSSDYIAYTLSTEYRSREAKLWLCLFDSSNALVADPTVIFAGRMDTMTIQDSGESARIALTIESRLADLQRARERRYTNEDQKRYYTSDEGLKYVSGLQLKQLPWGISNATAASSTGGSDSEGEEYFR